MTRGDLQRLKGLRAKLTGAPWHSEDAHPDAIFGVGDDGMQTQVAEGLSSENRDLIVAAIGYLDDLIEIAERRAADSWTTVAHKWSWTLARESPVRCNGTLHDRNDDVGPCRCDPAEVAKREIT